MMLQAGWFVDPVPETLPVWSMVLGLEALFIGAVTVATRQMGLFQQFTRRERIVGVFGLGLGYLFASLSVISTSYRAYAIYLFLLFRMVEGVAAVQFYRKLIDFIKTGSSPGDLSSKIKYHLTVLFIVALGAYLVIQVVTTGPYVGGFWYEIQLIYTVVSFSVAFLGVQWRLRSVSSDYNYAVVFGLGLCIAGAQIYDFTVPLSAIMGLAGGVTYSVGFWIAAFFLIRGQ